MWPSVEWETRRWEVDPAAREFVSNNQWRRIKPTYEAAVVPEIARLPVGLSGELSTRVAEVTALVARFDQAQAARGWDLPALMLRSESSSSSQIERLTSSARNVAIAEVSASAPRNARLIAQNVAAMREAMAQVGPVSVESLCRIHAILMGEDDEGNEVRDEQVWIGGTHYSPHGARFVPPHASRVRDGLDDLVRFGERDDVPSIPKAALAHAQFETIHPFTDGNGRTGRALLHRMLSYDGVLMHATLPMSAGLLHDVDGYLSALDAYHGGETEPIVERIVGAVELSVAIGDGIARRVDAILEGWREANHDRAGSASHRLPALLVAQPVVSVAYVSERLHVSDRAASALIERACERGILKRIGNARRNVLYQAIELIGVLEEASSVTGIRRLALR